MTEREAEDEVLRLCRATPAGGWVMRNGVEGKPSCNVFNLSRGSVRPYREVVAQGATWVEVLGQLASGIDEAEHGLQGRGPDAADDDVYFSQTERDNGVRP